MSLVVVLAAVPARLAAVPLADVAAQWPVVLNLLAGSLAGAWLGAAWATRMATATLYKVLAGLLVFLAVVFAAERVGPLHPAELTEPVQIVAGVVAGFGIGVVAAVIGVAGGELFIPTLVLLFAVDTKLAGSLSLLVSLPTMLVAFIRYSRNQAFAVLRENHRFVVAIAVGRRLGRWPAACCLVWWRSPCWFRCSSRCYCCPQSRSGVTRRSQRSPARGGRSEARRAATWPADARSGIRTDLSSSP